MRDTSANHPFLKWFFYLSLNALICSGAQPGWAVFPAQFTYQGSLKQNGNLVNGTYQMEFRITNTDGSQIYWTSGNQNVQVQEGLYRVELTPVNVSWSAIEPYMQLTVNGNVLLPREKMTAAPYAWTARDLAADAVAQGDMSVTGNLGIGTVDPAAKIHIVDSNPASDRDEIVYTAPDIWNTPVHMKLGFRDFFPSIQGYNNGAGNEKLSLNPDGGNVGIGITDPEATLTIYKHGLQGNGITNILIAAGYNTYYLSGGRQFLVQQWFNQVDAITYIVGNGYVSGTSSPVANDAPYNSKFAAIQFSHARFGFVWNNGGAISPALSVDSSNGNIGIGTYSQTEKLDVAGNIKLSGALKNEQGKPAFFVNVYADDCGWSHPYLGCPAGYIDGGRWHTGPNETCNSAIEGVGYENGSIDKGWMVLCVAQ